MDYIKLDQICNLNMGQSPSSDSYNQEGIGIPFFQGNADFGEMYPITRVWCDKPTKIVERGTLLISVRAPIGALNFATEKSCIGRGLAGLTVKNGYDLKYIYYALKFKEKELNNKGTGSTFKAISKSSLGEVLIPNISADKQKDYVRKLDLIQNAVIDEKELIKQLDNLIKARFVEMFGDPIYNTNNLPIKYLSELGEWASGGTPSRAIPKYFEGNINWYSAGELNTLFLDSSIEKITEEAIMNSSAKLFKAGSMLMGMYDTAAFKMGILKEDSASNQACACITPNGEVNIIWLYYELQLMKEHFLSQRRGVRQKNLNLGMIKGFEIPIADKMRQEEFVTFVHQTDKSKLAVQKALDETQLLFDSLMQQYFG